MKTCTLNLTGKFNQQAISKKKKELAGSNVDHNHEPTKNKG